MISAQFSQDFEGWRIQARQFLIEGVAPHDILWSQDQVSLSLFDRGVPPTGGVSQPASQGSEIFRVPAEFLDWAQLISCARDAGRWDLLYRILYRLKFERKDLLRFQVDPDIANAERLMKTLRRDIHKMHAFVRFKKVEREDGDHYVAWHRPEHPILRLAAPFFARRFGDRPWSLMTPDLSAHWDLNEIQYTPGVPQHTFQEQDPFDQVWQTYYASIFNPARLKLKAMKAEMAPQYWSTLPEAELIPDLIRAAPARLQEMARNQNRQALVPQVDSMTDLKAAALKCQACPIVHRAQNLVFGEGPEDAEVMIVGEQPGEQEDLQGRPFVGPAGEVLDQILKAAGFDRQKIYLTSAVKHFKWQPSEPGSKLRIHQKASGTEMHACRPWLEAEIARIKPKLIIALGATAGTALLGRLPKITKERGQFFESPFAPAVLLSWHPAAILRSFSQEEKNQRWEDLNQDLKLARKFLSQNENTKEPVSCF